MRETRVIYVQHGHYYLKHSDTFPPTLAVADTPQDVLLLPDADDDEGGAVVLAATFYGPVSVTVETYGGPADVSADDGGGWELSQDWQGRARGRGLLVVTESGQVDGLPALDLAPGEEYGVRVHACGRTRAAELQEIGFDEPPVEHHLLQLWRL